MNKLQAIEFLRMGATVRHISWEPYQSVHALYGYVSTHDGRVFTMEEFLRVFSNPYYQDGWCFNDPFVDMAKRTCNYPEDKAGVTLMATYLQDTFCKRICGQHNTSQPEVNAISNFWNGSTGMYRVIDNMGVDYLSGHSYSEEAISGFVKKLVALGVIKNPSLLSATPLQ